MKTYLAALIFIVSMPGCGSTYSVGSKESGADYIFDELNSRLAKKACTIVLTDEEEKYAIEVSCSKDSVLWREPLTLTRQTVAKSQADGC